METLGFIWKIEWSNPYTTPTRKRVLAELFVPGPATRRPVILDTVPAVPGYTCTCAPILYYPEPFTEQRRAKMRKGNLTRRIGKKYPMFAEQFIEEELTAEPDYYAGEYDKSIHDYTARLNARVRYLLEHANKLIVPEE